MDERVLPHNINAEGAVIGAMLIDEQALTDAVNHLAPTDFYSKANAVIFSTILELNKIGHAVDAVSLIDRLQAKNLLDKIGGLPYVNDLLNVVVSSSHYRQHLRIVKELALKRQLIALGWNIANQGFGDKPPQNIIDEVHAILEKINSDDYLEHDISIQSAVMVAMEALEHHDDGISTGFYELDLLMGKMKPGQLILLASRPSMGKTAFALQVAVNNAVKGKNVAVYSLEQTKDELVLRMVAQEGLITMDSLFSKGLRDTDMDAFGNAMERISRYQICIDDNPELSPLKLKSRVKQLRNQIGHLDLVIVDYLGLMTSDRYKQSKYEEVSAISRSLKVVAKDVGAPLLVLSQLNRNLEEREDKRPRLSDLRDSGTLEQDADKVVMIYRDEVYYPTTTDFPGQAEFIVRKNRNGKTGIVSLNFDAEYIRFSDKF